MKLIGIFFILAALTYESTARESSRIAGGSIAERGQLPYHVYIKAAVANVVPNFLRVCGGAYIRYKWTITAAHCVHDSSDLLLYFGMVNIIAGNFSRVEHVVGRNNIKIHHNFNDPTPYANDLALIYLENGQPGDLLDPYMNPIKLPLPSDGPSFHGRQGIASGFGRFSDDGDEVFSINLRYVSKPVISDAECALAHGSIFQDDHFCTATFFGSTCQGDEGAPFMIDVGNGREILAGIGSFGLDQCTTGTPPIFTNLIPHLDWIEEVIGDPPTVVPPENQPCVCHCYICPHPECPAPIEPAKKPFWKK